jgi:hypothetical protein
MGAKGGKRPGAGRRDGSKNKETIAKEAAAEMQRAAAAGRKLGVDILHDFATLFTGMAGYYQPSPNGSNQHANEAKFEKWARLAIECATSKAPFETPKLRAVMVSATPPPVPEPKTLAEIQAAGEELTAQETYRALMNSAPEPPRQIADSKVTVLPPERKRA